MSKSLKKVLKKIVAKDIHQELAVADAKLGGVIKVRILWVFLRVSKGFGEGGFLLE